MISFKKNHANIQVEGEPNLMQTLLKNNLPVASSCYGKGICARCRVTVIDGAEHLTTPTPLELNARQRLAGSPQEISNDERLSCQCRVLGTIKIDTSYW